MSTRKFVDRMYHRQLEDPDATMDFLILSGGGQNGAFGAGFLLGWSSIPQGELAMPQFDGVTGVSAGSYIAPFAYLGTQESLTKADQFFRNPGPDWLKLRSPIYFLPDLMSLATVPGLEKALRGQMSMSFAKEMIAATTPGRKLLIQASNLDLAIPHVFNLIDATRESVKTGVFDSMIEILLASSAIPGLLPPREIKNFLYVDGGVVGFYSLEMSAEQLAARILSEAAEIPSQQIRSGDMTETEFRRFVDAAKALEACPLFIDDTPALPISQLAARARRLKRTHGLDVLIIDYLQLVRGTGKSENRVNEISEITMGLKAIAKELDIPVIALSQLSRQVESRDDKRPQLSDLRESGSIEQDADVVMFVYREEYYKEREKPGDHELDKMAVWQEEMERLHGRAEVVIGKQRHGPIGTVDLSFEGRFTRFGNLVQPWQQGGGDEQEF